MINAARYAVIVAVALVSGTGGATAVRAAGNPEQGARLAYGCLGCHGIEGYRNAYPSYRVPKLGGQKSAYVAAALRAYRNGERPHPTMQAQGETLSDPDIEHLAAWFQGEAPRRDTVTPADVQDLPPARSCVACHGAQGEGVAPTPPTLSGQHRDYLVHALRQYRDGARPGNVMPAFVAGLSEQDIDALARFYSERDGLYTPQQGEQ